MHSQGTRVDQRKAVVDTTAHCPRSRATDVWVRCRDDLQAAVPGRREHQRRPCRTRRRWRRFAPWCARSSTPSSRSRTARKSSRPLATTWAARIVDSVLHPEAPRYAARVRRSRDRRSGIQVLDDLARVPGFGSRSMRMTRSQVRSPRPSRGKAWRDRIRAWGSTRGPLRRGDAAGPGDASTRARRPDRRGARASDPSTGRATRRKRSGSATLRSRPPRS